jgi:hypothetical protein
MNTFNTICSAIFDILLAPFGVGRSWSPWVDIVLWSVLGGIVALLVYKKVSNQAGIARTKNEIKVHLLEIRLYKDDILGVFTSTAKILLKNLLYLGHNMLPMVVMIVPMMAILIQLVAVYGLDPIEPGTTQLLKAKLDPAHSSVPATQVRLDLPPGIVLDAPPVRTADGEIAWRLTMAEPGDHTVTLHVGGAEIRKQLAVGGERRKIPALRTKSWEGLLYPGEDMLPSDSPVSEIRTAYPTRDLGWMPGGEGGILLTFFVLSIAAGLALKGVFNVTL